MLSMEQYKAPQANDAAAALSSTSSASVSFPFAAPTAGQTLNIQHQEPHPPNPLELQERHAESSLLPLTARRVEYGLEVIKSGTLVEERQLTDKPFITFGRSPTADVLLEHPSASRLHAVLQFRGDDGRAFLYDCGSTHGTFLNKQRVKAQVMAPLRCVLPGWVFLGGGAARGGGGNRLCPGGCFMACALCRKQLCAC
jgi:hypothetical protein